MTTTTLRDADGNVTATIDGRGKETDTTYDNDNRPVTVRDPMGHVTTTQYDGDGNATATIDASNNQTTFAFDNDGHVTAMGNW